jgi:hypothetical protein
MSLLMSIRLICLKYLIKIILCQHLIYKLFVGSYCRVFNQFMFTVSHMLLALSTIKNE